MKLVLVGLEKAAVIFLVALLLSSLGARRTHADEETTDDKEETSAPELGANVTMTSDYIDRGVTQTQHGGAIQGGLEWTGFSGLTLGVWNSNVRFADSRANLETSSYVEYALGLGNGWRGSLGAIFFTYWVDEDRDGWDFPLKVTWQDFSFQASYSPRWRSSTLKTFYLLAGWQRTVIADFKLAASAGYSFFSGYFVDGGETATVPDYPDFRIAVSREFLGVEWGVAGTFAEDHEVSGASGGSRLSLWVTKEF
jgi:uncharacterized protein (TIGR02001 family)